MKLRSLSQVSTYAIFLCLLSVSSQAQTATTEQSSRSYDFLNSLGVGVHMGNTTVYVIQKTLDSINYLGFKHVRDSINGTKTAAPTRFPLFAQYGIMTDSIIGENPTLDQAWLEQYAPYIEAVEGPNETDCNPAAVTDPGFTGPGTTALNAAQDIQHSIYTLVHADPKLSAFKVYNISLCHPEVYAQTFDTTASTDYCNTHAYTSGSAPYLNLPQTMAYNQLDCHNKPMVMTETGFPTFSSASPAVPNGTDSAGMVSEYVQTSYELDTLFDNFKSGVLRTYLYDLFDDAVDPGNLEREDHFGQFYNDGTPKPAATAIHNMQAILADTNPGAQTFTTTPLTYTLQQSVTGNPNSNVLSFHTVLQKANGAHELVLWSEPQLWNRGVETPVTTVVANVVNVTLDKAYQTINIYDPTQKSTVLNTYTNTNQISLIITDHPVVVEIMPDPAPVCGSGSGIASSTSPANLCLVGTPSSVSLYNTLWGWSCSSGSALTNCTAPLLLDGACGTSNGLFTATAPASGLCAAGVASAVTGNGPWSWTCAGLNGGQTQTCSATPDLSLNLSAPNENQPLQTMPLVFAKEMTTLTGPQKTSLDALVAQLTSNRQTIVILTMAPFPQNLQDSNDRIQRSHVTAMEMYLLQYGVQYQQIKVVTSSVPATSATKDIVPVALQ